MRLFPANFFRREPHEMPAAVREHKTLRKRLALGAPALSSRFVAFDTELTGLDVRKDSVISIGAVRMEGRRIFPCRSFSMLVRPESKLHREGVVVHGITTDDLIGARSLGDVLKDFIGFIGDSVLVGHFAYIDRSFLNRAMKKLFSVRLQNPVIDTSVLHEWLYKNDSAFARHYKGMTVKQDLFSMSKRYGIEVERAHNALYDAYLTAQLFQRFLYFLPGCGIHTLQDLLTVGKA